MHFVSLRIRTIEIGELARFVVTGITATIGNMAAVWLARLHFSFEMALLLGICVGLTISFVMSKWFAFRSRSINSAPAELTRFVAVYALSVTLYWGVAVMVGQLGITFGFHMWFAEPMGVLAGAGVMTVTSYLGHRFFTYRTYRNGDDRLENAG